MADDNESQYKLTEQQLAQIEAEIKSSQPLTSQLLPIDALIKQYSNDDKSQPNGEADHAGEGFLASSKLLATKYTNLRRIRGDGNCYYRAFLYSLCEGLLKQRMANTTTSTANDNEFMRIKQLVTNSLSWVCSLGYEESTIEMFYEELVELFDFIDNLKDKGEQTLSSLHEKLNEENSTSDYCTWYLRVLTAAQMKSNPDRYLPFLLAEESSGGNMMDIPTFCSREVEPMNRECGMVQVAALAECFGIRVNIEYMDGRIVKEREGEKRVACHEFGEEECDGSKRMTVALLYRPGHYDILY